MKSARRQLLHVTFVIGALILATATPTLARSGPAPTFQSQTNFSDSFALRLLIFLGVVVDDGVPF